MRVTQPHVVQREMCEGRVGAQRSSNPREDLWVYGHTCDRNVSDVDILLQ